MAKMLSEPHVQWRYSGSESSDHVPIEKRNIQVVGPTERVAFGNKVAQAVRDALAGKQTWFDFRNDASGAVDIDVDGPIGYWGVTADDFIRQLRQVDPNAAVTVYINSPGGEVFDGVAIWSAMAMHKGPVTAVITSLAASIASVFAMAADTIKIAAPAMMMIHNPSTTAWGEAKNFREVADLLDEVKASIQVAYKRTGLDDAELSRMMDETTWMSAARAVELGFADEVFMPSAEEQVSNRLLNMAPVVSFDHVPAAFYELRNSQPAAIAPVSDPPRLSGSDINDEEDHNMSGKTDSPVVDRAYLDQNCADLVAQIRAEGAEAERARIKAVSEQGAGFQTHAKLITDLMFDGKTDAGTAAMAILAAEKVRLQGHASNLANDADEVPVIRDAPPADPVPNADANLPLEDRCKKQWDASADLRAEFGDNLEAFIAFEKANSAGLVKTREKH